MSHFELAPGDEVELRPRYNIAPGQDVPVVLSASASDAPSVSSGRRLALRRWGLVPPWAKSPAFGNQAINARIESAAEKPAFREAFARRRCLVPADGFYEWRARGRDREPYHVAFPGRSLFAIAGLHEHWVGRDGSEVASCTLLTCEAHPRLRELHDRMPVLLDPRHYDAWLGSDLADPAALVDPTLAAGFEVRAVHPRVNSPRYDDPECLEPPPQLSLL